MKKIWSNIFKLIKRNWGDPVWSKVISACIISIVTFIVGLFCIIASSLFKSEPLLYGLKSFWTMINSGTTLTIKNYVVGLFAIFLFSNLLPIIRIFKTKKKIRQQNVLLPIEEKKKEKPKMYIRSTQFFDERMSDAFPGQRGLKWYKNSQIAAERLQILLKNPLIFNQNSPEISDPIWWFRGLSNLHIQSCKTINKTKLLVDYYEYKIDEIAAYRDDISEKNFVYVKIKGEKPVGVYNWIKNDIESDILLQGYCREEYGLYKDKIPITREEFDDGAANINGKITETYGSQLRIRYLSDYNFIIAGKQSPINSEKFDTASEQYLNGILKGTHTFENFLILIKDLKSSKY